MCALMTRMRVLELIHSPTHSLTHSLTHLLAHAGLRFLRRPISSMRLTSLTMPPWMLAEKTLRRHHRRSTQSPLRLRLRMAQVAPRASAKQVRSSHIHTVRLSTFPTTTTTTTCTAVCLCACPPPPLPPPITCTPQPVCASVNLPRYHHHYHMHRSRASSALPRRGGVHTTHFNCKDSVEWAIVCSCVRELTRLNLFRRTLQRHKKHWLAQAKRVICKQVVDSFVRAFGEAASDHLRCVNQL